MFVVPAAGLKIPDPAMRGTPDYYLPPEGREVQPSDYWVRRLRDGDACERVDAPAGDTATQEAPGDTPSAA